MFYFSQKNTEEQNTQRPTETLSQPISQNVTANLSWKASVRSVCRRRSVGSKQCAKRVCQICEICERKTLYEVCKQPNRGNLTYYSPPYGGGAGGGASWFRGWGLCELCKRRNCPAFLSCYFFVAKQRSSWYEKGY